MMDSRSVPSPKSRRIYWSVVAAAGIPSVLFAGAMIGVIAWMPRAQPARAHVPAVEPTPAPLQVAAIKKRTAEDDIAEIRLPAHAPVAVRLSDLPMIESDLPENPLAPLKEEAPKPVVAAAAPLPSPRPKKAEETCQRFGTAVDFVDSPMDAFKKATKEQKLTFVLHISGNFEDSKFT